MKSASSLPSPHPPRNRGRALGATAVLVVLPMGAWAHPVTWAGGSLVEIEAERGDDSATSLRVLHSPTVWMAAGVSWRRGELAPSGATGATTSSGADDTFADASAQGSARRVDRVLAHANVRFLRLNFTDAQANAYLLATAGGRGVARGSTAGRRVLPAARGQDAVWKPTGSLGLEVDAENLTRYGALGVETVRDAGGPRPTRATMAKARFGLLPYEPEANEFAGWLMTETTADFGREDGARLHRAGRWDFAPGARVFYRQFLTEVFVPLSGGLRVLLMYHF